MGFMAHQNEKAISSRFLLSGEDLPLCLPCKEPFSVKSFFFWIAQTFALHILGSSYVSSFDTVEPAKSFHS